MVVDDRIFDQMATDFGNGQSRRKLVRGLAGGGLAAFLAAVSLEGSMRTPRPLAAETAARRPAPPAGAA
jgi:hypothetical protein